MAEVAIAPGTVTETITFQELTSAGGYGEVTTTPPVCVQLDQAIQVNFNWTQSGALFGGFMGQHWSLKILFEMIGENPDPNPATIAVTEPYVNGDPHPYSKVVTIPAGHCPDGIFRIVSRLALVDMAGKLPVVAHVDHGLVEFHDA